MRFLAAVTPAPLLLVLAQLQGVQPQQCFHPNGTATNDLQHQPCSNSSSNPLHTICCAINRPNEPNGDPSNGYTRDECLPNGLCQNRWTQNGGQTISYWREECTEENWSKGLCLDVCTGGTGSGGNVQMTPCDGQPTSEKWCCGTSDSCCDTNGITIPKVFGASLSATPSATSSKFLSSTTTASATLSGSITPSSSAQASSGGLSTGTKVGVAVGVIVGVAAFFGVGYFFAKRRHMWTPQLPKDENVYCANHIDIKDANGRQAWLATAEVQELSGNGLTAEAPSEVRWKHQELP